MFHRKCLLYTRYYVAKCMGRTYYVIRTSFLLQCLKLVECHGFTVVVSVQLELAILCPT